MNEDIQLEKFLGKILAEEVTDQDVLEFTTLCENYPHLKKELAECLAMTELVSQNIEEERSGDCFTELVKSAIKSSLKPKVKDKKFVESVKKKIIQENKHKTLAPNARRKSKKRNKIYKKKSSNKILLFLGAAAATLFISLFVVLKAKDKGITQLIVKEGYLIQGHTKIQTGQAVSLNTPLRVHDQDTTLQFPDGSEVKIYKGSMISFFNNGTRKILLNNGRLDAKINPQKQSELHFETPFSLSKIIGTEFTLRAENWRDTLEVKEGKVSFKSLHSEQAYFVTAGEKGTVFKNGTVEKRGKNPPKPTVKPGPIKKILLIHHQSGEVIKEIKNNDQINLAKFGKKVNIIAEVENNIKVLLFVLNGKIVNEKIHSHSTHPTKHSTHLMPWTVKPGKWHIRLIPYHVNGKLQREHSISITVK